jgi:hypothetical protein
LLYELFKLITEKIDQNLQQNAVTVATRRPKPLEGVIWPVLQSSGGKLDRFIVYGGKVDNPHSWRGQVDFFLLLFQWCNFQDILCPFRTQSLTFGEDSRPSNPSLILIHTVDLDF